MMTDIKSALIIQPIALMNIPKGEYKGTWSGYQANAIINGEQFRFETTNGVRGINVKCTILVNENGITLKVDR